MPGVGASGNSMRKTVDLDLSIRDPILDSMGPAPPKPRIRPACSIAFARRAGSGALGLDGETAGATNPFQPDICARANSLLGVEERKPTTTFVFFVGTNGSGTTLHRAIFDSHPDLAIPGESHFIARLGRDRERYEGPGGFHADLLFDDLQKENRFTKWGLDPGEVEVALSQPEIADFPEAIRCLYRIYAARQGKSRYGDKTQAYIHEIPLIAYLFPEARFVHAVRDGRDVALAHTDGTKIEQVAVSWKRRVSAGKSAGEALGPDRYIESRFEELIDDTERSVRRICDFIGIEFDPVMLRYYERAGDIVSTTAVPDRHRDIYLPPTKGLRDWRRELSEDQVMRFEALAGDLLDDLGYERAYESVPIGKRVAAWSGLAVDASLLMGRRALKLVGRD
jgi:hypothetical protein